MSTNLNSTQNLQLPGYEALVLELSTLLTGNPPPFIFINDRDSASVTANVVRSLVAHLSTNSLDDGLPEICYGLADAKSVLSPRLLYESFIHTLVDFIPSWEDGCSNWRAEEDLKWNENMDSFLQGLRLAHSHLRSERNLQTGGDLRLILMLEGSDRLKETMPDLLVPLTRLRELVCFTVPRSFHR